MRVCAFVDTTDNCGDRLNPIDTYVRNAIEWSRGTPRNNLARCRVHTNARVYTRLDIHPCVKLLGKLHGFTDIYVREPYVTLKRCLRPDRAVMCLRVISGSQLIQLPNSEEREKSIEEKEQRRLLRRIVIINYSLREKMQRRETIKIKDKNSSNKKIYTILKYKIYTKKKKQICWSKLTI